MRFTRNQRLLTAKQFQQVFERGQRVSSDGFVLHFCANHANATLTTPRLGLAISRKADPRAVIRNRVKRIVRESFRTHAAQLPVADYVMLARAGVRRFSPGACRVQIDSLWQSARLKLNRATGTMTPSPTRAEPASTPSSDPDRRAG